MERLEPLNVLAFIHDELLLFDDHNHSTPSDTTWNYKISHSIYQKSTANSYFHHQ